jgi:hypothetical protein
MHKKARKRSRKKETVRRAGRGRRICKRIEYKIKKLTRNVSNLLFRNGPLDPRENINHAAKVENGNT